jgi:hypothetical protein
MQGPRRGARFLSRPCNRERKNALWGSMTSAEQRMLDKLRHFVQTDLDATERVALARLIAPGVEEALFSEAEVEGFGDVWLPDGLANGLANLLAQERSGESEI